MRVTLVAPESARPYSAYRGTGSLLKPPVGIMALAAALAPERDVRLIHAERYQLPSVQIADRAVASQPDIVGLSVNYSYLLPSAGAIARRIRESLGPDVPIVWGGNVPTFAYEMILRKEVSDFVVRFEADRSFPELLRRMEARERAPDVPGVSYVAGAEVVARPFGGYVENLDDLGFPSYSHLDDPTKYLRAVMSTRGCCYDCIYCSTRAMWGRWRARSAANILEEIRRHVEEADPERLHFLDDNFPVTKSRVREICRGIGEAGWRFRWGFSARVELVDAELLQACADAGCNAVYFGIESGSEPVLRLLGRRYSPADVYRIVDQCVGMGILPTCSFMIGIPGETEADVERTFEMMEQLNTPNVQLHVFTPLIGTPAYTDPERYAIEYVAHDPADDTIDGAVHHSTEHLAASRIEQLYLEGRGIVAERDGERVAYLDALRDGDHRSSGS